MICVGLVVLTVCINRAFPDNALIVALSALPSCIVGAAIGRATISVSRVLEQLSTDVRESILYTVLTPVVRQD